MRRLFSKSSSDHLMLCVFLSLLWGLTTTTTTTTISTPTSSADTSLAATYKANKTTPQTRLLTTPLTTVQTTKPPPSNPGGFKSVARTETSITLQWNKVDNIINYTLVYNGNEINIPASPANPVKYIVPELTSGTLYDFSLYSVFGNVNSSGVHLTAPTAPSNPGDFTSVARTETSITLQWNKVDNIINYTLVYNRGVINITKSANPVMYTVQGLTSGTMYDFSLYSVFENVSSSGVNLTAPTAPSNPGGFTSVARTETSITLQWNKVDNIINYTLVYNGNVINIPASPANPVKYIVPELTSGTLYDFSLYSVFGNVNSSGVHLTAPTAPSNPGDFTSVARTETSITLQWNKVDNIINYTLVYNGNEINITTSADPVKYIVPELTSGTLYDFSLYSVFGNVSSSGVHLTAPTAPSNPGDFTSVARTETSITLQWNKVDNIINYTLVYNGNEININTSADPVMYTVPGLTSGTLYDFSLYSVFGNVNSSGVHLTAPTAPSNPGNFTSVARTETSITLQWNKVDSITTYTLVYNRGVINITKSANPVMYTVPGLTSGTMYDFSLYSVFENVSSSGVNLSAPSAPRNTDVFISVDQNETTITLQWKKVDNIINYTLEYNGRGINVTASAADTVMYTVPGLTSGTKYHFSLFTVFENIRSSGVNRTAVTAPSKPGGFKSFGQNETSITLQWNKVHNITTYTLVYNENVINVTASAADTVMYTVPGLTNATKYDFSLYSVFENVNSSGITLTTATAPPNTNVFKSVDQNETSITLQWNKVNDITNYTLEYNGSWINVTASGNSVMYTMTGLKSGTKYDFSLFTVFANVRSSGVNINAVTAPENVNNVTVSTRNESSITLVWNKVNNISTYILQYANDSPVEGKRHASHQDARVTQEVSPLEAGKKYDFTLITVFENVNSTGYTFNAVTVPPEVGFVNVTRRDVKDLTLEWVNVDENWSYLLQINGESIPVAPKRSTTVSQAVTKLQAGTKYEFSVITVFSKLNSTAYTGVTVTVIDCASVAWHVTNSSIQGMVKGLFSKATATNNTKDIHVSPGGSNVSFTGLYPGATYSVSLIFENKSTIYRQCRDNVRLTISPPDLRGRCENWAAGYSIFIVLDEPDGVWTAVEVNVSGTSVTKERNESKDLVLSGFLPAKQYEVSLTSLSGSNRRSTPYVFQCYTDPRGVIAGVLCSLLLFVLLCLVSFIVFKKRDTISKKMAFIGGSRVPNKSSKPISVAKFPEHFYQLSADENKGFGEEYENLLSAGTEQTRKVALLPENKPKNRFTNVLPYDWSRVKLSRSRPNETSDYINASYMPGFNSSREYIASQGPLPATVDDFWTMIWEQKVKSIVMVTNCTEGGRIKCEQYWPPDSNAYRHGELLVTMTSEQQEPNWTLREFRVKHKNTSEERIVNHFHFTAWPDHGVPQCTEVLIQFRELVRQHIQKVGNREPTVVHCSAGVGRTGTIIALDVLLQQLERDKAVGINAFVHKMRLSRPHMVQTESQYVFLHQCIMDCLNRNETTEDHIYENVDTIYVNATALQQLRNSDA